MPSATVCAWIDTTDFNDFTSLASYAIRGNDNAYLMGFRNSTWLNPHIMNTDYGSYVPQTARPFDVSDKVNIKICLVDCIVNKSDNLFLSQCQ